MMRLLEYERIRLGYARTELSEAAKLSRGRVGQIETGRATPPRTSVELVRLAEALDLDGDPATLLELVTDEQENEALSIERERRQAAYEL